MVQTMVNPGRYYSEPGIHRDMTRTGATEVGVDSIYFDNFVTADTLDEIELMTPAPDASDAGGGISDGGTLADVATDPVPAPAGTGGASGSGGRAGSGGTGTGGSDLPGTGGAGGSASGSVNASGGCTVGPAGSSGPTAAALLGLLALWKRRSARIRKWNSGLWKQRRAGIQPPGKATVSFLRFARPVEVSNARRRDTTGHGSLARCPIDRRGRRCAR
jgi:MYXO-CTERM domain-containing protein